MKKMKGLLAAVMAVLSLSLLIPTIAPVQAATTEKVYVNGTKTYDSKTGKYVYKNGGKKKIISTLSQGSIMVYSVGGVSEVKKLKVNKSGLKAKITHTMTTKYENSANDSTRESTISLYATKKGTYKVTFKVASKSYSVTVKAVTSSAPYKKVTYGSSVIYETTIIDGDLGSTSFSSGRSKVSSSSGKFTVEANKDASYVVTGLVVATANAKGNPSYKKVKNGGKITLSKGKMKHTEGDIEYVSAKKYTHVYVSYKNTWTNESVTYSVAKDPSTKKNAVKCVVKDGNGNKTTTYWSYGYDSDFSIWK